MTLKKVMWKFCYIGLKTLLTIKIVSKVYKSKLKKALKLKFLKLIPWYTFLYWVHLNHINLQQHEVTTDLGDAHIWAQILQMLKIPKNDLNILISQKSSRQWIWREFTYTIAVMEKIWQICKLQVNATK